MRYTHVYPTLQTDVRIRCYTAEWWLAAVIVLVFMGVFTIGFPVGVLAILYTNRNTLVPYGKRDHRLGFLYNHFRVPQAPYWQVRTQSLHTSPAQLTHASMFAPRWRSCFGSCFSLPLEASHHLVVRCSWRVQSP